MSKLKTEWNLSQLYASPNDSRMEKDIILAEKAYSSFAKKYAKTRSYLTSERVLANALLDYEKLMDIPAWKSFFYLKLSQDKDSEDQKVRAKFNLISERLKKMSNTIVFFDVALSKISKPLQTKFLASKQLLPYRYFLKKLFRNSKFILTEPEEKILSLKSLPAHGLWTDAVEKMLGKQTVEHKGKQIPVSEASYIIKDLPTQNERKELHTKVMNRFVELGDIAESEINAIVIDKKINDQLRGYDNAYDATILGYENEEKTILNLVETTTKNFHLARRFYRVKKKMLGLSKLAYFDRAVSAGKTKKKIPFEEACKVLGEIFASLDSEFAQILHRFTSNGQIDAYPKVGKHAGAYCWADHNVPTFVLLNHTDSFEALMTFGHEMGHGIHGEMSKSQPVLYEGHSITTAETASTLFEAFVFYHTFEKLSDKEKIVALHDKIQSDVQSIFRQIACFNFEMEMHKTIREKGNMSKEELAACMNKHMKSYLGDVELSDKDGYFFVGWSHIRRFFYVYSYAFGQLASKAFHKKWREDHSYIHKIKKFLSLGGSMSPEDIFKSIGVDVTKPDFWKKGIESIEEDIVLLESLVNKKKK